MSAGSLARRYAKALMAIGTDDGTYERIGKDVAALASAMKASEELKDVLSNPAFPRDDREKIVRGILQRIGASQTVVNFVRLLLDRERMGALVDISRELNSMINEKSGQLTAEVTSASALSPDQQSKLVASLEKLSGKKIKLETKEDPELLGGVVAKVGDLVYDGSLKSQLKALQRSLAN
jgi:F-type H+-transporting ATPase subunit delta